MLSFADVLVPIFYLIIILVISFLRQQSRIEKEPIYQYYTKGLLIKIVGAIAICLIYSIYYGEGDTTNFFYHGGDVLFKLFLKSPTDFFKVVFGERDAFNWALFDNTTEWPYYYKDANAFFVVRIVSILSLFTFHSYIATSILLAWISYSGIWKLFKVFCGLYPTMYKQLAIAILFIPSVAFWGSGLLKDTITLSAVGWYTYSFYQSLIKRDKIFIHFMYLIISSYILIAIKPYIFYALLPGSLIWLSENITRNMDNKLIRRLLGPFLLTILLIGGYFVLKIVGQTQSRFALDTILERAVITQQDLKRGEAYGTNYFDVGEFNASIPSMLSRAPVAIVAGLYRPFIWEVKNPMMLISAMENIYFIVLTVGLFRRTKVSKILSTIKENPLILSSLIFALFFSFSVGLTTANFGALVRYRIPAIPFFISSLLLIRSLAKQKAGDERQVSKISFSELK